MKKVILFLAVAAFVASCDNAADSAARAKDSLDSIAKIQKESINEAGSEAKENIDSATKVMKDSLDSVTGGADTTNINR